MASRRFSEIGVKTGRNKYISIDAGSAGQRTSAILTLLLQISKEPIIIDQPEDDLDTKILLILL